MRTPAVITEPEQAFNRAMGAWLKTQRERSELTLQALADRMGTCRNTIWNLENGRSAMSVWMYKQLRREFERVQRINLLARRRAA